VVDIADGALSTSKVTVAVCVYVVPPDAALTVMVPT
jgi:hypothetical protein